MDIKEKEFYYMSKDKKTRIHAKEWSVEEKKPIAIVQLSHGMKEHIGRYERFAQFLAQQGYIVAANDHLGHGSSVRTKEHYGYFVQKNPKDVVVGDMHTLRAIMQQLHPGLPYFMIGHSMGSFLLRRYLMMYGEGLKGAVLMGTGMQPTYLLKSGKALIAAMVPRKGWGYKSAFIDEKMFYNAREHLTPEEDPLAWMTRDEKQMELFKQDEQCNFLFTLNGYYFLLDLMLANQKRGNLDKMPKELPVLFLSGKEDPVGHFGEGVKAAYQEFIDCGMKNVCYKLYPEARHELLNELNYDEVYEDILKWLEKNLPENSIKSAEDGCYGCSIVL